jgi:hypothetical protein
MSDLLVVEARLNMHEEICAERYADIKKSFERIHADQERVSGRMDKMGLSIIGLLIAIVGWLLIHGVPWRG